MRKNYKVYRIFVDLQKDGDLAERLDRLPRPLRGDYIRMALHRFIDAGEGISQSLRQEPEKDDLKQKLETISFR